MDRSQLLEARRVVVKLGTRVLTHDDGRLALSRLYAMVEDVCWAWARGVQVLMVSSGAVGLGREALGLLDEPLELPDRQACAAVGQARLMTLYDAGFTRLGRHCAQVLLTQSDFDDRARYLDLRNALQALLARGVVPIINENDVVSTEELALVDGGERPIFGDNDRLSALVATKLGADLLVLLTDVEGVYARDPRDDPDAPLLERYDPGDHVEAGGVRSAASRGGMRSKLDSARLAARGGCHAVIASGRRSGVLPAVLRGEVVGTLVPARDGMSARHRWIAFATAPRGLLHLDAGAVRALRQRGASLLAAGVVRVEGTFAAGDVVSLVGPDGAAVGRGVVSCSLEETLAWCAGSPPEGRRHRHALIDRGQLVLEER